MVALLQDDYAHHWEVGAEMDVDGVANQAADRKANLWLFYHCDEMKVKDGLVYDINSGRLIVRFRELVSILELLGL